MRVRKGGGGSGEKGGSAYTFSCRCLVRLRTTITGTGSSVWKFAKRDSKIPLWAGRGYRSPTEQVDGVPRSW